MATVAITGAQRPQGPLATAVARVAKGKQLLAQQLCLRCVPELAQTEMPYHAVISRFFVDCGHFGVLLARVPTANCAPTATSPMLGCTCPHVFASYCRWRPPSVAHLQSRRASRRSLKGLGQKKRMLKCGSL